MNKSNYLTELEKAVNGHGSTDKIIVKIRNCEAQIQSRSSKKIKREKLKGGQK